jgi:hypothetical protein
MFNLLPPAEKKAILLERQRTLMVIIWFFIFFFFAVFAILLFWLNNYIVEGINYQKILIEEKEKEQKKLGISNILEETKKINNFLIQLNNFYKNKIYFSDIIEEISSALPQGIYLTSFSITSASTEKKNQVFLSGFSPIRENLFELKKNLENNKNFEKVYFPPSNWTKPKDINFSVSFELVKK